MVVYFRAGKLFAMGVLVKKRQICCQVDTNLLFLPYFPAYFPCLRH